MRVHREPLTDYLPLTSDLPLRQALTRLLLINEIAAEASASIDRRRVAAVLHRHAQSLLDVEDALLVVREHSGNLRLVIPETREVSGSDVPATRLFAGGVVADALRARTTRIVRDTTRVTLAPFERTLVARGAAALAAAPLVGRGVVHGAILFWALTPTAFDQEARRTITMVVPHVANALMMASLVEEVEARSLTDPLTGLANRRWLEQRLDEELDRVRRYGRPLCLALLDIDHFKAVNDRFGHAAGDEVLRKLAALLLSERRSTDLVCRYGGEELVLILPETWPGDAVGLAERIRARTEGGILGYHADGAPITVSIGIAGTSSERDLPSTLFAAADAALYRAKSDGRNQVRLANDVVVGSREHADRAHADTDASVRPATAPEAS
jgi:diguanylate cyclase (GGDEF)-like protein